MRRKGLYNIRVGETIQFEVSYYNKNNWGKTQYSGFINENKDEYWYLPTHQALVDELIKIPRGSLVKATRLTQGGPKEACKYKIEILRRGSKKEQLTLDSF